VVGVPARRLVTAPWWAPVVEVGTFTPSRLLVDDGEVMPDRDGVVRMFVNDAILPLPRFDAFYRNNHGGPARVRVREARVPAPPPLAPYTCEEQRRLAAQLRDR